jgi:hypothetical protein
MPRQVDVAVFCLWMTAAVSLGMVFLIFTVRGLALSPATLVSAAVVAAFSLAIYGGIAWKLSQGRNWARIVYLIIVLLWLCQSAVSAKLLIRSPLPLASVLIQAVLHLTALTLLFTNPGRHWFRPGSD